MTGWIVAVDVPLTAVNREVNDALGLWMLFALAAALLAIGAGVVFGHFLSRQLQRAAAYAMALGREETPPTIGPTSLREVASISNALETARVELDRRMGQQRLLSRELNHRVKNLISVVKGVAKMSFANGAERPQEALLDRLQSLARSQDLLIRSDWTDLPLREIVEMETLPFAERISIDGPAVQVTAANVQTFALLLHELTTNAVKYGALRDGDGAVEVRWSTEADRFSFRWKERCGQPLAAMDKPGFGSTLLKRAFGNHSCRRFELEADGLVYEMSVALAAITG